MSREDSSENGTNGTLSQAPARTESTMTDSVLCVIPAKRRSRRLSGKNLRPLAGVPLILHTIRSALQARRVDRVVVSTDCTEIAEVAARAGADVPSLRRPHQSDDDVHASVPVIDMLARLGGADRFSYCAMLLPTAPLRPTSAIDDVIELSQRTQHNVVSVAPVGKHLLHLRTFAPDGTLETVADKVPLNFQSDAAPALYALNGSVYCAPSRELIEHGSYHYGHPLGYAMPASASVDIDSEDDFQLAERLIASIEARDAGARA
jgi:CMP-N-acetylneuraminic acid synthetase